MMIPIYAILAYFFLFLQSCGFVPEPTPEPTGPPPSSNIFPDTASVDLEWPPNDTTFASAQNASTLYFQYFLPDNVEYAVVALFTSDIDVDISERRIRNPGDWVAGSRSGMGLSRSVLTASNLLVFNTSSLDFDSVSYQSTISSGSYNYYWAVWGYDKSGNLTHSSPRWYVRILWP